LTSFDVRILSFIIILDLFLGCSMGCCRGVLGVLSTKPIIQVFCVRTRARGDPVQRKGFYSTGVLYRLYVNTKRIFQKSSSSRVLVSLIISERYFFEAYLINHDYQGQTRCIQRYARCEADCVCRVMEDHRLRLLLVHVYFRYCHG